jgi:hypothetical protein
MKKLGNSSRWWLQDALRKAKAQGKVDDGSWMLEEVDRDSVVDELYVTDRTRFKQAAGLAAHFSDDAKPGPISTREIHSVLTPGVLAPKFSCYDIQWQKAIKQTCKQKRKSEKAELLSWATRSRGRLCLCLIRGARVGKSSSLSGRVL